MTGHDKMTGQDLFLCPLYFPHSFSSSSSSSVSLSYFYLAVPLRKCSGEHSCMSSQFSLAILNGSCSLPSTITVKTFWTWRAIKLIVKTKNKNSGMRIVPTLVHVNRNNEITRTITETEKEGKHR